MNSGALDRVLKINISFFIYTNPSEEEEEKGSPEAEVWSTTTALSVLVVIVVFIDNSFSRKSRKKSNLAWYHTHTKFLPSSSRSGTLCTCSKSTSTYYTTMMYHSSYSELFFSFESGKKTKTFIWRKKEERRQKLRSFLDFYVMRLVFFY